MRSLLLKGATGLFSIPLALVGLALFSAHTPAELESPIINHSLKSKKLKLGETFKLLSWNLQYAGSRKHNFFYDGGPAVHVPPEDVEETISAIRSLLEQERPDIALLQELDRDSSRTGRRDQLRELVEYRSHLSWTSATYHRSPFVPAPSFKPLGRIDLHLGIISAFALKNAQRRQLALLQEFKLRQVFNLKRALLTTELPIEKSPHNLHIGVTHLSAFSYGDGTLGKQVQALKEWIESRPRGAPWILAGDLNLLPPGDDPSRLSEEHLYADKDSPISTLIPAYQTLFEELLSPEARTYFPFGAAEPDRKIDYIFYGGPLEAQARTVLPREESDHRPLIGQFKLLEH